MESPWSIKVLLPAIAEAGTLAGQYYRHQARLGVRFKADHTLVTEADLAVEALLRRAIGDCFPQANILGEEGEAKYETSRPYTFALDPIDGTAAFASGTPGWAICVGVLNRALQPVAGIVSAPCWDSLFIADFDPSSPATHNGIPLSRPEEASPPSVDHDTTILVDSKLFRTHQLRGFPGKCRSFGSTALHICLVAQHTAFALAHSCPVYVWDIAAAHAIAQRTGLVVHYLDGRPLTYQAFVPTRRLANHLVAGLPPMLTAICPMILPLPSSA